MIVKLEEKPCSTHFRLITDITPKNQSSGISSNIIFPNSLKWTQCSSNTITAIFEFENAGTIYTFVYCSMSISELPDIPHDRAWIQSQMPHKEKEWEVIIIEIFATTFFNKNLNPIVKVGGTYIINFTIHLTIMPRGGMLWYNWNLNS